MDKDQPAASDQVRELWDKYDLLVDDICKSHQRAADEAALRLKQKMDIAMRLENEASVEYRAAMKPIEEKFLKELTDHGDRWMNAMRELAAEEGGSK